jgi:hypothetical protein
MGDNERERSESQEGGTEATGGSEEPADKAKRILVVADETVVDDVLPDDVRQRVKQGDDVVVVFPSLNSRLRHWMSDEDKARAETERRREVSVKKFEEAGVKATGEVGDPDPVQALDDALRKYGADEVIIAPRRRRPTHWLEKNIVARLRSIRNLPKTDIRE